VTHYEFFTNTLKGFNMEFNIEFCDLEIEIKTWVEWEYDPEYSPDEGVYDKFIWSAYLMVGDKRIDITDDLSSKESKSIEKQIEEISRDCI
jgi:hypothetical protein